MNFGLEGVTLFSPVPGYSASYSASFSKRFSIVSSPLSPIRRMDGQTMADNAKANGSSRDRRMSEGDSHAVIQYEDCTGAIYRIRKGISEKTPLQVS